MVVVVLRWTPDATIRKFVVEYDPRIVVKFAWERGEGVVLKGESKNEPRPPHHIRWPTNGEQGV